jgi:hypothetical protein
VFFGTDAYDLPPRDTKSWKIWIKRKFWLRLSSRFSG